MAASRTNRAWTLVILFLAAIIITGGVISLSRLSPGQPLTITGPPDEQWQGEIYIGGGVNNPGIYDYRADDTLESLVGAAGGPIDGVEPAGLELYVTGTESGAQKVDINRAEDWLLEALPGIGETLARRIIDYRQQNGPFRNTNELLNVTGIGEAIYRQIKPLITVAD
ncbi:MAG: ComEA family DNA-binding protein [Dehalococcoidales bacterium]